MANRETELRDLSTALCELEVVEDAWLANSFTDRLLIVDLQPGASLPSEARDLLSEHHLIGFNEVYNVDNNDDSLVGSTTGINRHQFVDIQTRGKHQSYVID